MLKQTWKQWHQDNFFKKINLGYDEDGTGCKPKGVCVPEFESLFETAGEQQHYLKYMLNKS